MTQTISSTTNNPTPLEAKNYLNSLTGLRFIAAATIFGGHTLGAFSFTIGGIIFSLGLMNAIGMPLFFVLSGFIVHYNYANSFQSTSFIRATGTFLLARFSRIYPLFLAVFIYYLVQDRMLLGWIENGNALLVITSCILCVFTWFPLYSNGYLVPQCGSFGVMWSIPTEFFFYYVYTLISRPISRLSTPTRALAFFIFCIVLGYAVQIPGPWDSTESLIQQTFGQDHPKGPDTFYSSHYRWLYYLSPYSRIFEFLLGCSTAQLLMTCSTQLKSMRLFNIIGMWATLAILAIMLIILQVDFQKHSPCPITGPAFVRYYIHLYMNFLLAPLMASLILICASRDLFFPKLYNILAHPKLVFLGEISLSLYLVHPIVITLLPIRPDMTFIPVRIIISFGIIVALSIGTYTLIEVPARTFLRRLFHIEKKQKVATK